MTKPIQRHSAPSPNASRSASPQQQPDGTQDRSAASRLAADHPGPPGVAPARRPPAGEPAAAALPLDHMPPNVLQAVAGQLAPSEVVALGSASRTIALELGPEVSAARVVTAHAPGVSTLARFDAVLGPGDPRSVAALPSHLQAEPLAALAGRVMGLAPGDQPQAIQSFLAFDHRGEPTAVLDDLRRAAHDGPTGLRRREASLVGSAGAAAVRDGGNILAVAQRLAISGANALGALEASALDRAHRALEQGESVPDVARRLGISSQPLLDDLNRHATSRVGVAAVGRGEDPAAVAARLGITHPASVGVLNQRAARHAVGQGQRVDTVAAAFNITGRDVMFGLELHAAEGPGAQAVSRGESVVQVAERLGIRSPGVISRLERTAVDSAGAAAVRQGESLGSVATRLGIRDPVNVTRLAEGANELPPTKRARLR